MDQPIILLPEPRLHTPATGAFELPADGLIRLDAPQPQALMFTARRFQQALLAQTGYAWQRTASPCVPAALTLRLDPDGIPHSEGYRLEVTPLGVSVTGHDEAAVFYGVCTLIQLLSQAGRSLPCLEIEDWPDFPARGVMLDVSRDKVPQMSTLYDLVDRLAGWKINQLQLYIEHTFAYPQHPEVWQEASPFTAEEILELDAYCRQRYIELVPNQNSFGHMHRWLNHSRYAHMAEIMGEIKVPWGKVKGPYGLAPVQESCLPFLRGLYDEMLPNFSSRMVNVGCDETFDLGQGQSRELVEQKGVGRVYLDFLQQIYADISRRGYTMQFWGDIITQHPELVPDLPRDALALLWGYEENHPFDRQAAQFAAAGIRFYVCPGTSSWCSIGGRTHNAVENLRSAAASGLKHGAVGYLITDWGDHGHWQMLPVSYLGFAVGAAFAWCSAANAGLDIPRAVGRFAFDDRSGVMGRVACDLGDVYRSTGILLDNNTLFFRLLQKSLDHIPALPEAKPELLEKAIQAVNDAIQPLSQERMARADADLVRREFLFTARLMRHACYRGLLALQTEPERVTFISQQLSADMKEILEEYRTLWLARNRPGGLRDSIARFEALQQEYAAKFLARFLDTKTAGQD